MNKFGIEIEFLGYGCYPDEVYRLLMKEMPAFEDLFDDGWNLHEDWSVEDKVGQPTYATGCEIVSPILTYGEQGFEQVRKVMNLLDASKEAYVNETCGFHVHFDARFLRDWNYSKRLMFFTYILGKYAENEAYFDYLVAPHRREDKNTYCHSVGLYLDTYDIFHLKNEKFLKLNVSAYEVHGTIEFRQHEGTLDAEKALKWIKECHKFYTTCVAEFEAMTEEQRMDKCAELTGSDIDAFS